MTTIQIIMLFSAYLVAAIAFHGLVAFVNAAYDGALGPWRSGELALFWPVMVCAVVLGSIVFQFVKVAEYVHAKATQLGRDHRAKMDKIRGPQAMAKGEKR